LGFKGSNECARIDEQQRAIAALKVRLSEASARSINYSKVENHFLMRGLEPSYGSPQDLGATASPYGQAVDARRKWHALCCRGEALEPSRHTQAISE